MFPYSLTVGLRPTRGDSGIMVGEESIFSSEGVGSGVGDCMLMVVEYGALWGNGEISIESRSRHGGEDGCGGGVGAETSWGLAYFERWDGRVLTFAIEV